jgi:hypothetical protein
MHWAAFLTGSLPRDSICSASHISNLGLESRGKGKGKEEKLGVNVQSMNDSFAMAMNILTSDKRPANSRA